MTALTWSRLRTFVQVAEAGSIRGAATALHVTEPAVSSAISAIERELGVALSVRDGRGLKITEAGARFAEHARTVLGMLDEAAAAAREDETPRLRVGAVSAAAEYVLPQLLAAYRKEYPGIELSLLVLPRNQLFDALSHHECDVVIAGRPPRGSGLRTRATRANTLQVIGSPTSYPDPMDAPWLLRSVGSGMREATMTLLSSLELSPVQLDLGTHGAVVAGARAGLGVTLAHADAVATQVAEGSLRVHEVAGTPIDRPWVVSSSATMTGGVRQFVAHICDVDQWGDEAFHTRVRPAG